MLTLNLPTELEDALNEASVMTKMTREALVEEAIRRQLEDIEDVRIAEERLANLEDGRSERISLRRW